MKEEYINNINTQKEVLAALPQNNLKNTKIYQEKIAKLLADYEKDLILLTEEIVKRKKQYLQSVSGFLSGRRGLRTCGALWSCDGLFSGG